MLYLGVLENQKSLLECIKSLVKGIKERDGSRIKCSILEIPLV